MPCTTSKVGHRGRNAALIGKKRPAGRGFEKGVTGKDQGSHARKNQSNATRGKVSQAKKIST